MAPGRPIGSLTGQYSSEALLKAKRTSKSYLKKKSIQINKASRELFNLASQVSNIALTDLTNPNCSLTNEQPVEQINIVESIDTVLENELSLGNIYAAKNPPLLNIFSKKLDHVEEYGSLIASFFASNITQNAYSIQIERENMIYNKSWYLY